MTAPTEKMPLLHTARAASHPSTVDGVGSLLSPRDTESFDESTTYTHFAAYGVMINYIIGTGVFSLPYAFYSAGNALATSCVIGFAVVALLCLLYTLEMLARAEGVTAAIEGGTATARNKFATPIKARSDSGKGAASATRQRVDSSVFASVNWELEDNSEKPEHAILYRKFDFVCVSELFGGATMKYFTQLCVTLYCYGALWSYAAVFASSADTLFFQYVMQKDNCNIYDNPSAGCHLGYYICCILFGIFVTAVSMKDISSQKTLQLILTFYRFLAFTLMLITVYVAIQFPNTWAEDASTTKPYVSHAGDKVKWTGFGTAFTFSAVALNVHYNYPDIVQPVKNPKNRMLWVAGAGLLTAASFYCAVGWSCVLLFGDKTIPLITLNWNSFSGHHGGWGAGTTQWWALIIKLLIMLFPAINMLSVYPLICVTLGDNIMNSIPKSYIERWTTRWSVRTVRLSCRIVAALPPLALGLYTGKLDEIFTVTGLFAILLELIIPPLLLILSHRYCVKRWGPGAHKTPYTIPILSSPYVAGIILIFGVFSLFFSTFVSLFPADYKKLIGEG